MLKPKMKIKYLGWAMPVRAQVARMRFLYPSFSSTEVPGGIEWSGTMQPDVDGPQFRVTLRYAPESFLHNRNNPVQVRVEGIQFKKGMPHINLDSTLCLFYPDDGDRRWTPHHSIADTIVLWVAEWLQFFLWWRRTGIWYGPNAPHDIAPSPKGAAA